MWSAGFSTAHLAFNRQLPYHQVNIFSICYAIAQITNYHTNLVFNIFPYIVQNKICYYILIILKLTHYLY